MALVTARGVVAGAVAAAWLLACPAVQAADVGGWFAEQQLKAAAPAAPNPDACPQLVARATTDAGAASASSAYQAALCYLQAASPDPVAARAWLARAAELGHLSARRTLQALQSAESGPHGPQRHCHDLGEGRQICHGGAAAESK